MSPEALPAGLKMELMVKSKVEDPEVQKQRQEMVNNKSVAELGEIHGLSDFPIPTTLQRLVNKEKRKIIVDNKRYQIVSYSLLCVFKK